MAEAQRNTCLGCGSSVLFIVLRFMSHAIAFNLVSEMEISEAEPGLVLLLLLPRLILSHFLK